LRITPIEDPEDPRIAAFRDIRERDLTGREGLFIAEGSVVVRTLASAASLCRPRAVLLAAQRVDAHADVIAALPADVPVYAAGQVVLDRIAGFPLHRGVLALGEKPAPRPLDEVLAALGPDAVVLAAMGIGNHDNIGGLFRNAAALGAGAVLLDDRCCDPFYRKAVRVSVGGVLRMPSATGVGAEALLDGLERAGFEVLALSPGAAEPLTAIRRRGRTAVLVGPEGPGLPPAIIARCRPVSIPMAGGFDSLNVATAAAIALHHLWTAR
jgi:tRNA G18 (ribose-2'-O)-methylase SpoU